MSEYKRELLGPGGIMRHTEFNSCYFTSLIDLNNSANTSVDNLHEQNFSADV